uniref:Uncharacterized protein n=1 Tax=Oryza brachyantha TaxID=4533 RepID=J3LAV2_ORYBR
MGGAARIRGDLQAILVMLLLLPPPFLPGVLAAGSLGRGNFYSGEPVVGGWEAPASKPPRALRFLTGGAPANPGGEHDPPVSNGR